MVDNITRAPEVEPPNGWPSVSAETFARFEAECRRAFARGLYARHLPAETRTRLPNAALLHHLRRR